MQLGTPASEILVFLLAYGIGGIPFGWLLAWATKRVDLRKVGSGGTGATNASRLWSNAESVLIFVAVFVLDFGKGALAFLLAGQLAPALGSTSGTLTLQVIGGIGAVLGHMFTPYLHFRGGKGVATTFGVVTALAPFSSLLALGVWALLVVLTRYMSLGSLGAMLAIPLSYALEWGEEVVTSKLAGMICLVVLAGFVAWRHRANITRLLQGRERKVGAVDQQL